MADIRTLSSSSETAVRLSVEFRDKVFNFVLRPSSLLVDLSVLLEEETGALQHTQTLLLQSERDEKRKESEQESVHASSTRLPGFQDTKPRTGTRVLKLGSEDAGRITVRDAGIQDLQRTRLMGATEEELRSMAAASASSDRLTLGFEEEERRARQRYSAAGGSGYGSSLTREHFFDDFRALELPGVPLFPPKESALLLLKQLASDPGIAGVMKKHGWRVGLLSEMAPHGLVGVSPVCVLGVNKNRGQEISLRLRTDDLRGFRKIESIRRTLIHELAHMVFDAHDNSFKALNSQLTREAAALDWTRGAAQTVDAAAATSGSPCAVPVREGGPQAGRRLLDGGAAVTKGDAEPQKAAARAAEVRLLFSQSRMDERTGEEEEDKTGTVAVVEGGDSAEVKVAVVGDALCVPLEESKLEVRRRGEEEEEEEEEEESPEAEMGEGSGGKVEGDGASSSFSNSQVEGKVGEGGGRDEIAERTGERIAGGWEGDGAPTPFEKEVGLRQGEMERQDGLQQLQQQQKEQQNARAEPQQQEESIHQERKAMATDELDLVLNSSGDSAEGLRRVAEAAADLAGRVRSGAARLASEVQQEEQHKLALRTLVTVLRNAMSHPTEPKYRKLRKDNPSFYTKVGRFQGALDILRASGFEEDTDSFGGAILALKRHDPGMLWLAKSTLESTL